MATKKISGAKGIVYDATEGTLVSTGALTPDAWYKVYTAGTSTALPSSVEGFIFQAPSTGVTITLASGDSVLPLTLEEVCKVDTEISGEMGTIDVTDSCDSGYTTMIVDGYTTLSGSINTMMRFDELTGELSDASQKFVNKFFDVMEDDAEGVYTFTPKDDSDLLFFWLLNKDELGGNAKVLNYLIVPIIMSSITMNIALKDAQKGDYAWSKGQGPAVYYKRHTLAS